MLLDDSKEQGPKSVAFREFIAAAPYLNPSSREGKIGATDESVQRIKSCTAAGGFHGWATNTCQSISMENGGGLGLLLVKEKHEKPLHGSDVTLRTSLRYK
eukprot:scaffold698_cov115-Skeletonema_dohrnii-CCMP3373.AAC.3